MQGTQVHPWVPKIPWRGAWQSSPEFLPGESHGQRSLVGYSPRGCIESDMTEQLTHTLKFTELVKGYKDLQSAQIESSPQFGRYNHDRALVEKNKEVNILMRTKFEKFLLHRMVYHKGHYYSRRVIFLQVSLTAQLVKNRPAMQAIPVRFLGQEDLLEKGQATHSCILRFPLWPSKIKEDHCLISQDFFLAL